MDRCPRILAKMSEEVYITRGGTDSPMAGSLLTRAAACVNCSRDSTIRGMHEAKTLLSLGSLRTINPPRSFFAWRDSLERAGCES